MQIYQILNTKTGKSYIGKSSNYLIRYEKHKKNAKEKVNRRLYDSMNYHGVESFNLILLEDLGDVTRQFTNYREQYWISTIGTLMPFGYNMTSGGDGGNTLEFWDDEQRKSLYKRQGDGRRGRRNKKWCDSLSCAAKIREEIKTLDEKIIISEKISKTRKEKYKNGELLIVLPPIKFGETHHGYKKIDVNLVLRLIKRCHTQLKIADILGVSVSVIRERLRRETGKTFLEWRRYYGINGRLSAPRVD